MLKKLTKFNNIKTCLQFLNRYSSLLSNILESKYKQI